MDEPVSERITLFEALTSREVEILSLLAEGLSDREIADRLTIAYTTVKWYNRQIFNKLGVEKRRDAIERAQTLRLLPSAEVTALPRHNLPAQMTLFVGRDRELQDLARLLVERQTRLITLLAPGGMGKTRLALGAAEAALPDFANGVFFVPLAPLTAVEQLISTIAEYTSFQFSSDSRTPKNQLLDFFREKSLLLILDNFEHLLDGASLVTDILQAARGVVVIVTSRERLNLSGETVYTLGGMTYPEAAAPPDMLAYGAVALFEQSARRAHPDFLVSAEMENVIRVCQLVQGMPLAIELAAGWAGALSTTEIVAEISRSLDFLQTSMRDVPERLRSVRAVFESTWKHLDESGQTVFRKLSVFRGGCTREAAQVIAGADIGTLTDLVNKALLWRTPKTGRYEVHELLRQYAEQELEAVGEADESHNRHSHFYLNSLQQRRPDLEGQRQLEALQEIENDIENIRAAWLWAAQQGHFEALGNSIHELWLYYLIRGGNVEGMTIFAQAADVLQMAAPGKERNTILGSLLAREAFFCSELYIKRDEAEALLEQSRSLLQYSDSPEARAFLALTMGRVASIWKTAAEAQPLLEIALGLYREIGDRWYQVYVLMRLGRNALGVTGSSEGFDLLRAKAFIEEALTIQRKLGEIYLKAQILGNLGIIASDLRQHDEAERLTLASIEYHEQLGNRSKVAADLNILSIMASSQNKMTEAIHYLEESLALSREAGDLSSVALVLGNLSANSFFLGDFVRAEEYAQGTAALAERTGNARKMMQALDRLGSAAWALGRYDEAEDFFKRAVSLGERESNQEYMLLCLLLLADATLAQGKLQETRQHLERVMHSAPHLEQAMVLNMCQIRLGKLAYEEQDYIQAREYLEKSLAYFRSEATFEFMYQNDENEQIVRALIVLGDIECAESSLEAALSHYHEALEITWTMRHLRPLILMVLAGMVELLGVMSQPERAVKMAVLVREHPSAYAVDKERAVRLLETLQKEMPVENFAAAVERGKALELEAVVAELLADTAS